MAETLVNQPVVAKYKKIAGKDDLGGHECSVDKNGNVKFGTATIGVNTAVEVKDDDVTLYSGETVNTPCLFVTSRIWKRNSSVCDAIKRLFNLGQLHSSWEILSEKTEMVDGVKVFKKISFLKVTAYWDHVLLPHTEIVQKLYVWQVWMKKVQRC